MQPTATHDTVSIKARCFEGWTYLVHRTQPDPAQLRRVLADLAEVRANGYGDAWLEVSGRRADEESIRALAKG